jgi:hypothetical protein
MMFLLLSGVIDFGRAFYYTDAAVSAARAGTQYGILSAANMANVAGMKAAAEKDAEGIAGFTAEAEFFCQASGGGGTVPCDNPSAQGYVKVKTAIVYPLMLPWPGIPNPLPVGGLAVMRVQ